MIGPFRSGTTILEKIIGDHPEVGHFTYMSNVYNKAPVTGYLLMNMLWRIGFLDKQILSAVHNPRVRYDMFSRMNVNGSGHRHAAGCGRKSDRHQP